MRHAYVCIIYAGHSHFEKWAHNFDAKWLNGWRWTWRRICIRIQLHFHLPCWFVWVHLCVRAMVIITIVHTSFLIHDEFMGMKTDGMHTRIDKGVAQTKIETQGIENCPAHVPLATKKKCWARKSSLRVSFFFFIPLSLVLNSFVEDATILCLCGYFSILYTLMHHAHVLFS